MYLKSAFILMTLVMTAEAFGQPPGGGEPDGAEGPGMENWISSAWTSPGVCKAMAAFELLPYGPAVSDATLTGENGILINSDVGLLPPFVFTSGGLESEISTIGVADGDFTLSSGHLMPVLHDSSSVPSPLGLPAITIGFEKRLAAPDTAFGGYIVKFRSVVKNPARFDVLFAAQIKKTVPVGAGIPPLISWEDCPTIWTVNDGETLASTFALRVDGVVSGVDAFGEYFDVRVAIGDVTNGKVLDWEASRAYVE